MGLTPPPPARRDDTADVVHGVTVPDPYRWLEDADTADTRAWVTASNERTRAALDDRPGRDALVRRYTELFSAGAAGAPSIRGGRLFSIDRWGDLEQAVLVVRDVHGDRVPVPARWSTPTPSPATRPPPSTGTRRRSTGASSPSARRPAATSAARCASSTSPRASCTPTRSPTPRAASVAWLPDGSAFAYTRYPDPAAVGDEEANYNRTVWWHVLGDDPGHDELVFGDLPDRTAWPSVELSRDGRWLIVELSLGWTRVDVHLIDRTTGARTTVIEGVEAIIVVHGGRRPPRRHHHARRPAGPGRVGAAGVAHARALGDRGARVRRRRRGRGRDPVVAAGGVHPVGAVPAHPPAPHGGGRIGRADAPRTRPRRDRAARARIARRGGRRPRQRDRRRGVHVVGPPDRAVALGPRRRHRRGRGRRRGPGPVERPALPRRPRRLRRRRRALPLDRRHRDHAVHRCAGPT